MNAELATIDSILSRVCQSLTFLDFVIIDLLDSQTQHAQNENTSLDAVVEALQWITNEVCLASPSLLPDDRTIDGTAGEALEATITDCVSYPEFAGWHVISVLDDITRSCCHGLDALEQAILQQLSHIVSQSCSIDQIRFTSASTSIVNDPLDEVVRNYLEMEAMALTLQSRKRKRTANARSLLSELRQSQGDACDVVLSRSIVANCPIQVSRIPASQLRPPEGSHKLPRQLIKPVCASSEVVPHSSPTEATLLQDSKSDPVLTDHRTSELRKLRSPFRKLAIIPKKDTVALKQNGVEDTPLIAQEEVIDADSRPVKKLKRPFKRHVLQPRPSTELNKPDIVCRDAADSSSDEKLDADSEESKRRRSGLSLAGPADVQTDDLHNECPQTSSSVTTSNARKPFKRLSITVRPVQGESSMSRPLTPQSSPSNTSPSSPPHRPGSLRARQGFKLPTLIPPGDQPAKRRKPASDPTANNGWETASGTHLHIHRDPKLAAEWTSDTSAAKAPVDENAQLRRLLIDEKLSLQKRLTQAKEDLKTATAARKIETRNEGPRLAELTLKWRGVAQQVCDQTYVTMAAKVEAAGGLGALNRESKFAHQWFETDESEQNARKQQEQDEYELSMDEKIAMGIEPVFTMGTMLQQFGIPLETIRWNESDGWY